MKEHPGRITKVDKELVKDLDYDENGSPVQENDFGKIEKKKKKPFTKLGRLFQNTFQIKNLKTQWIYYL